MLGFRQTLLEANPTIMGYSTLKFDIFENFEFLGVKILIISYEMGFPIMEY